MARALQPATPAGLEAVQGHIPLCLVQHDDRTDKEISPHLVSLLDLNRAVCQSDPSCRLLLTRTSLNKEVEPHWQKLFAVQAALQEGCQHAVWLDTDAIVHTSEPRRLLEAFPAGTSFFSNADPPAIYTMRFFRGMPSNWNPATQPVQPFNAGVWGVRNTARGRALMDAWIGLYPSNLWSVERKNAKSSKSSALCVRVRPGGPAITRLLARTKNVYRGSVSLLAQEETPHEEGERPREAGKPAALSGSAAEGALASAEKVLQKTIANEKVQSVSSCDAGVTDYAFHEKWRCVGSAACDTWANSDAFEQGAFAAHILASPEWRKDIHVADAGRLNSPCESFGDAEKRDALSCHFLAEYKDSIDNYLQTRARAAKSQQEEVAAGNPGALRERRIALPDPLLTSAAHERTYEAVHPMVRVLLERVDPYLVMRSNASSTVCHVGAEDDGRLAQTVAAHLRMPNTVAMVAEAAEKAAAEPASEGVRIQSFGGSALPRPDHSCDVVVVSYLFHHPAHAHKTARLLREAARISRGFVLVADNRAGRTVDEVSALSAHDPHGIYRTTAEWESLLHASRLELLASGPMAHARHGLDPKVSAEEMTRVFYIARPMHGHAMHWQAHGFDLSGGERSS